MRPLRPDDLIRPGCRLGHAVAVKLCTGSTNDDARALAEAGVAAGVVVLAEEQDAGRGRLDRRWLSEPGQNLLFSVILRPTGLDRPGLITLAAGVGLCAALRDAGVDAKIKWPNDLRAHGRKLAGILCEAGRGDGGDFVILGIGLNVNQTEFAPELAATSVVAELGQSYPRPSLFRRALAELEAALAMAEADPPALLSAWMDLAECKGRRVRAQTPAGIFEGEVLGLDQEGALIVLDDDHTEHLIEAGDVQIQDRGLEAPPTTLVGATSRSRPLEIPEKGFHFLRKCRWSKSGQYYFITSSTNKRKPILASAAVFEILRESVEWMETNHRWEWHCFVCMPDHIHIVFKLGDGHSLAGVMKSFKSFTSRRINKLLQLDGVVWQDQYYDHLIRGEEDFWASMEYCYYNPLKKGLLDHASDYRFWMCKHKI